MTAEPAEVRTTSFGQGYRLSLVDRFGTWLSARSLRRKIGSPAGRRVLDVGCGYEARFARTLAGSAAAVTLIDVAVNPALSELPGVRLVEGALPEVLAAEPDGAHDIVMCMSVLEHVWDDETTLRELCRVVAPGGVVIVNVPSWRGKAALELSAFRLKLSPAAEMDDHKRYYDPRDLWPRLVRAGFVPHLISCRRHKFGLNTIAVCRAEGRKPT